MFQLPASFTIEVVESLAAKLREHEKQLPVFKLDASRVEIVTTPGIQLLLSLAKTLETDGIHLAISHMPPVFTQAVDQLGLTSSFATWELSNG